MKKYRFGLAVLLTIAIFSFLIFHFSYKNQTIPAMLESISGTLTSSDTTQEKLEEDFLETEQQITETTEEGIEEILAYTPYVPDLISEEEKAGQEMAVVGAEFAPEGELLERLTGLVPDYSKDWNARPDWSEKIQGTESERELYHQVKIIGKTDSFLLYGTNNTENMILETQDGTYLWIASPYTSIYCVQPSVFERDFDHDGENELLINGQFGNHGTGVYIESLFVADKESTGKWKVYQLLPDWYTEELKKHYQTEYIDGKMNLRLDGELVGGAVDTYEDKSYYYSGDMQIQFQIKENDIYLRSDLLAYSDYNYSGSFWGNGIQMRIVYQGEGKWDAKECSYIAAFLESEANYAAYTLGSAKELTTIQYDPMLVRKCMTKEGYSIPVTVSGISSLGNPIEISMELFYEISEEGNSGQFKAKNISTKRKKAEK